MANNSIVSEIRSNFHRIYYEKIAPFMQDYEKERKKILNEIRFMQAGLFVVLILFLILGIFLFYKLKTELIICFLAFIAFILLGAVGGITHERKISFKKKLKKECLPEIMSALGNIQWVTGRLPEEISDKNLEQSCMFYSFNRRSDDDIFEGELNGVKYLFSETYLAYNHSSGKDSSTTRIFWGIIIRINLNKTINYKTVITTRKNDTVNYKKIIPFALLFALILLLIALLLKNLFFIGFVGIILLGTVGIIFVRKYDDPKVGLKEVQVEDAEFNKTYKLYSSDEAECRSLITPDFIRKFRHIQKNFGTQNAKCAFFNNVLMIALPTKKNMFEIGNIDTPLNTSKHMEKFFNELISILSIIDYFKLNETIDSKIKQELPNDQNNN